LACKSLKALGRMLLGNKNNEGPKGWPLVIQENGKPLTKVNNGGNWFLSWNKSWPINTRNG